MCATSLHGVTARYTKFPAEIADGSKLTKSGEPLIYRKRQYKITVVFFFVLKGAIDTGIVFN